ncbi:dipeptidase [Chitinophagaceae bacterium LWZ2-11]
MKILFTFLCAFTFGWSFSQESRSTRKAYIADTHNDILTEAVNKNLAIDTDLRGKTKTDLKRLKEGNVKLQIFSIWCDGTYGPGRGFKRANREIDTLHAVIERNPSIIEMVGNIEQLNDAQKTGKIAAMIGVEGGHMIEDKLENIDSFYKRGVRYMTLTWNNSTSWATSAMDETNDSLHQKKGLNDFGKQVVQRMNALGMMVDLSHVGEQTFWDAINTTTKPVIVSHSSAFALCPVFRNLKDDQIKAVAKNGGVIDVNFYSGFTDSNYQKRVDSFTIKHKLEREILLKVNPDPTIADQYLEHQYADEIKALRPPLSLLIDHIEYLIKLAGIDHVGIGSDFDGISSAPQGLEDVTSYPLVINALKERGHNNKDINKIMHDNFIRVFKANEAK